MTKGAELDDLTTRFTRRELTRRQMLGRLLALGITMSSASAIIAACSTGSSGSGTSTTSTKAKAIIGIIQEPTSLDPTSAATASIALLLLGNVYEGLVRLDPAGKIVPGLATKWDVSTDGTSYTFHLAQNVKWHDGGAFSAQDVKYSWDRAQDPANKNPHVDYWAPVTSVAVVDDHTVKVTLKAFSFNWLFHMTAGSAAIVSSKTQAANATSPIGTGPFKFANWNRGAVLSLTRNDAYWGDKSKLKDVDFTFITDANAMNNALRAGDIDIIQQVGGPEQVASFKSDAGFKVLQGEPSGKLGVYMNNSKGPLKDKRVRQAIAAAIDRKAWIDGIQAGYAVAIGSHSVPNGTEPYYVDETAVNAFNPTKAKQLLADAGVSNLVLHMAEITDFPYAVRGTDILVSELKDIGVTLKVDGMQFAAWLPNVFLGPQDYDLTIINHAEARDIANYANPKYYWHYDNPQVASQLTQADAEPDDTKRTGLYGQILKTLADDSVHAWVYSPRTLAVAKHNVQGFPAGSIAPGLYLGGTYFS